MSPPIISSRFVGFTDPILKFFADAIADAAVVALHRAVAHAAEPDLYPLPPETDSFEQVFASLVRELPADRLASGHERLVRWLASPRRARGGGPPGRVAGTDMQGNRAVEEGLFDRVGRRTMQLDWSRALALDETHVSGFKTVGPQVFLPPITAQEAIAKKYEALGGAQGFLGAPTSAYGTTPGDIGHFRHYASGSIYFTTWTGAREVHGAIREKWKGLGWEQGPLGFPTTDELKTSDGTGRYSQFEGGSIYWTPTLGAHEMHGAIHDKWKILGSEKSVLGYPVTDQLTGPAFEGPSGGAFAGVYNDFEHGSVYALKGTHEVHGAIHQFWKSNGGAGGYLGYPISDEIDTPDGLGRRSIFQHGSIYWYPDKGAYAASTEPISKLGLGMVWLQCIDETGKEALGGEEGFDDMYIGGVATGADGKSTKFGPIYLGQFNDGTWSNWKPFILQEFPVNQDDGQWPKGFIVTMVLMEKDQGGYGEFLDKVMTKTEAVVKEEFSKQGAAWLGAAIGSGAGPGGIVVGYIAGLVAAYVVTEVFDALEDIVNDDIFKPLTGHLVIPGPAALFHGWQNERIDNPWWVTGHDGYYAWQTYWALY